MSFKSEVDAEAEKLIKQGISPMEALKQAIQHVSEKKMSEIEQAEAESGVIQKPREE